MLRGHPLIWISLRVTVKMGYTVSLPELRGELIMRGSSTRNGTVQETEVDEPVKNNA